MDGEDVLLRAVLDLEQGRPVVAARQFALALDMLAADAGMPAVRVAALASQGAGLAERLTDPQTAEGATDELAEAMAAAGDLVDRRHAR